MDRIIDIINMWDPIEFFPLAPKDEYLDEVKKIYEYITTNKKVDPEMLAAKINDIFLKSFGEDVYKEDVTQCRVVAEKILNIKK